MPRKSSQIVLRCTRSLNGLGGGTYHPAFPNSGIGLVARGYLAMLWCASGDHLASTYPVPIGYLVITYPVPSEYAANFRDLPT